jgi:transposase
MDNASFHRKNALKQLLIERGREDIVLIFLPPYSPDYNPIEHCWANLKKFLRNSRIIFSCLYSAIQYYFNSA